MIILLIHSKFFFLINKELINLLIFNLLMYILLLFESWKKDKLKAIVDRAEGPFLEILVRCKARPGINVFYLRAIGPIHSNFKI
jgi:hypothetical protein